MEKRKSNVVGAFPGIGELSTYYQERCEAYDKLYSKTGEGSEMTDWLTWPKKYIVSDEYKMLKETAKEILERNSAVVILGIGGSYLTPKMVIESVYGEFYNEDAHNMSAHSMRLPKIYFAGCDENSDRINSIVHHIIDEETFGGDWSIIYISKSGGTIEPAISFRVFWDMLYERYGDEAHSRVYAVTDSKKGILKGMANEYGWKSFVIPDGIGGRYSGLTACGLLPIAIAGIDTDQLLEGAIEAMEDCEDNPNSLAGEYAEWRYAKYADGFAIELLANMNPNMMYFGEWWKQLFGESEGKEGEGIFPASAVFSTDLHSLGQFLQEGQKDLIFETFLSRKSRTELYIPKSELKDSLDDYEKISFEDVTNACRKGSFTAHSKGGNPCGNIYMGNTLYDMGYIMQTMFVACSVYCYMIDVNPFNQPGVEFHKRETKQILLNMKNNT